MYALLALAVLIALVDIANSLTLSIHERKHELGLLRAVGMTRGQTRRCIQFEAILVAVIGTLTGLVVGTDPRHPSGVARRSRRGVSRAERWECLAA